MKPSFCLLSLSVLSSTSLAAPVASYALEDRAWMDKFDKALQIARPMIGVIADAFGDQDKGDQQGNGGAQGNNNQGNNAQENGNPGQDVNAANNQKRQFAELAGLAVEVIPSIAGAVKDGVTQDKDGRSQFVQQLLKQLHEKDPKTNYVVCHSEHDKQFDGQEGKDWTHDHEEFDIKWGGTIGYEIYAFKSGTFTLKGNGGWENWGYYGNVESDSGKENTSTRPRIVKFRAS